MKKPICEWSDTYLRARLSHVGKNLEACRIAAERCRNGVPGYGPMARIVADENLNLRLLEEIRDEVERREQLRSDSDAPKEHSPVPALPSAARHTASDTEPSVTDAEIERICQSAEVVLATKDLLRPSVSIGEGRAGVVRAVLAASSRHGIDFVRRRETRGSEDPARVAEALFPPQRKMTPAENAEFDAAVARQQSTGLAHSDERIDQMIQGIINTTYHGDNWHADLRDDIWKIVHAARDTSQKRAAYGIGGQYGLCNDCGGETGGHSSTHCERCSLRHDVADRDQWKAAYYAADKAAQLMDDAIQEACGIIELGDQRLLASDGPAGNQPPDLSLAEWRRLYGILDGARKPVNESAGRVDRSNQENG